MSVTSSKLLTIDVTRTGISGPSTGAQPSPASQSAVSAALTVRSRSSLPTCSPNVPAVASFTHTSSAAPDARPAIVTPTGWAAVLRAMPKPNGHSASRSGVIAQNTVCVTCSTPGTAAASSISSTLSFNRAVSIGPPVASPSAASSTFATPVAAPNRSRALSARRAPASAAMPAPAASATIATIRSAGPRPRRSLRIHSQTAAIPLPLRVVCIPPRPRKTSVVGPSVGGATTPARRPAGAWMRPNAATIPACWQRTRRNPPSGGACWQESGGHETDTSAGRARPDSADSGGDSHFSDGVDTADNQCDAGSDLFSGRCRSLR